jgi:formylglycine-generating enzyme required for sulfatase activity
MKIRIFIFSVFVLTLTAPGPWVGSQSAEANRGTLELGVTGKQGELQPACSANSVSELPPELLHLIFEHLGNLSFHSIRNVSKNFADVGLRQIERRLAVEKINSLIGRYAIIPSGSYMMGPPEPGPEQAAEVSDDNELIKPVVIEKSFRMSETRVTQGQYEALLPKQWKAHQGLIKRWAEKKGEFSNRFGNKFNPRNFLGKDLPILRLTRQESNLYIEKLRERLRSLWAVAYPRGDSRHNELVLPRKPTEAEWEYATTKTIEGPPELVDSGIEGGGIFQITARHQEYAHGASEDSIPPRGRLMEEGPFEETPEYLKMNSRGVRGMGGVMWDETSDLYITDVDHVENLTRVAVRGGSWCNSAQDCRSSSRAAIGADDRSSEVGLRLVSDL